MKTAYLIIALVLLIANTSIAQRTYSKQNLEQVSTEELDSLFAKAKKHRTVGIILTTAGSVAIGTLYGLSAHGVTMSMGVAYLTLHLAALTFIVGAPTLIINSLRLGRINQIKISKMNNSLIEFSPTLLYSDISSTHHIGLSLRLKF